MLELILWSALLSIVGIQGIGFSSQFPDSGSVLIRFLYFSISLFPSV